MKILQNNGYQAVVEIKPNPAVKIFLIVFNLTIILFAVPFLFFMPKHSNSFFLPFAVVGFIIFLSLLSLYSIDTINPLITLFLDKSQNKLIKKSKSMFKSSNIGINVNDIEKITIEQKSITKYRESHGDPHVRTRTVIMFAVVCVAKTGDKLELSHFKTDPSEAKALKHFIDSFFGIKDQ